VASEDRARRPATSGCRTHALSKSSRTRPANVGNDNQGRTILPRVLFNSWRRLTFLAGRYNNKDQAGIGSRAVWPIGINFTSDRRFVIAGSQQPRHYFHEGDQNDAGHVDRQ
jgi:hypothetical protein